MTQFRGNKIIAYKISFHMKKKNKKLLLTSKS